MRRKQFMQLISGLRGELSRSSDPAVGVSDLPQLKQTIARNYETLYDGYDWPHLRKVFDRIPLNAGQRHYDFPDDMDYDNVENVAVWVSSLPQNIERGISFDDYASFSSDDDVRADPVLKWDVRFTDTRETIEVWPIPASSGSFIQFIGKRKFQPLVDDADLCLLDDQLVILTAAVELMPVKSNVKIKLAALQERLGIVKGRTKGASAPIRMGLGGMPSSSPRAVLRVRG